MIKQRRNILQQLRSLKQQLHFFRTVTESEGVIALPMEQEEWHILQTDQKSTMSSDSGLQQCAKTMISAWNLEAQKSGTIT